MAKKDKNEDEYKDKLDNSSKQDDEDFGLPDLDDDESADDIVYESKDDSEEELVLPTEDEISNETITFDDEEEESSNAEVDEAEDELMEEVHEDDAHEHDEEGGPVGEYVPPKESSAPIIITLSIIVIVACVAVYFFFLRDVTPKEPIVQPSVKDTTTFVVEKPVEVQEVIEEPAAEIKVEALITTLNTRSGRSYVIVGSFFDDDLAMDYAKQLRKKGTSTYIIPPFGKSKFTRVAVEETSSFADASSKANKLSGQYKEQPWPLKY
ncbi:MAG: hypothetical protein ACI9XJ_001045 [Marivirga sp.]|jgi:hypothetical protein